MFWIKLRRVNSVSRIRTHFAALGFPLDEFTDEETEKAVITFGRAVASVGLTVEEAGKAMAHSLSPRMGA